MSSIVDIHTHIYPPSYLALLRSRSEVPRLLDLPNKGSKPRLIILPSDEDPSLPLEQRGRPIDASYSSLDEKLKFMDTHSITISIISLANPWLDFLDPHEGSQWALKINNELSSLCTSRAAKNRLYAFASLPLSASPDAIVQEITRISRLPRIVGVVLGTTGLGDGLDDPNLTAVWAALEKSSMMIFLHPHYGLPASVFGPRSSEYGHVLPLALGFPMETTIAFTRMYSSGVFDRHSTLKILIAHAGGAVPFLSGRIRSCVDHERHFQGAGRGPKRGLSDVLRTNVWLDAVVYSATGVKAAAEVVGVERVFFGTDHPFFPPLDGVQEDGQKWASVEMNVEAIREAFAGDAEAFESVLGANACSVLGLEKG